MSTRALPPQVAIVCDVCGYEMEFEDGLKLYFEDTPKEIARALEENDWQDRDGKHVCSMCVETEQEACSHEGPRLDGRCGTCLAAVAPVVAYPPLRALPGERSGDAG